MIKYSKLVVRRIIQLYDRLIHKYRFNIPLLKQYLTFCYKIHSKKHFFKAISTSLASNPSNLELWLLAVYYELEVLHSPFKARRMFLKGLKINGRNFDFWVAYFSFELRVFFLLTQRQNLLNQAKTEIMINEDQQQPEEKTSLKDQDFISFSGRANTESKDGVILNGKDDFKIIEILKVVYDNIKEKFGVKKAAFSCLKAIKECDVIEIKNENFIEFKKNMLEDLRVEMEKDEKLAFEAHKEGFFPISIDFDQFFKKNTSNCLDYIQNNIKSHKNDSNEITKTIDFLSNDQILTKIFNENSEKFFEIIKELLQTPSENLKNFLKLIENKLMIIVFDQKKTHLLNFLIEIKKILYERGFSAIEQAFIEKTIKLLNKKPLGFTKKELKTTINCFVNYVKYHETPKFFLDELVKIAKENFLLFPEMFAEVLTAILANCEEKNDVFKQVIELKNSCPFEIWLSYLENNEKTLKYKEIQAIFKRICGFWPNNVKILQKFKEFEEKNGNFFEAEKITVKLNELK